MLEWLLIPSVAGSYLACLLLFVLLAGMGVQRKWRLPWTVAATSGTLLGLIVSFVGTGVFSHHGRWYIGGVIAAIMVFGVPLSGGAVVGSLLRRGSIRMRLIASVSIAICLVPIAPFLGLIAVCTLTGDCL